MSTDLQRIHDDLQSLGLPENVVATWLEDYAKLAAAPLIEPSSPLWWSDEAKLIEVSNALGFAPQIREAFVHAARGFKQSTPSWWTLLGIASVLLISDDDKLRTAAINRPQPPTERWGELADMYHAMVHFTAAKQMLERHRALNIPAAITKDTADDLPLRMEVFHAKHGRWGTTDIKGWFNNHLRCKLYKLGRLQFLPATLDLPCVVLGNKQNQYATVIQGDLRVRPDGQFASADHGIEADNPDNWTTTFTQTSNTITGHRVNEHGAIEKALSVFDLTQWQVKLQAGDQILTVHIPARGRLDTTSCLDSFDQAQVFYPRYYPGLNAKAFTCVSWLMDPQLVQLQQGQANLGKFVKLFHSVPVQKANDRQVFERVFDGQTDLQTLPRDTTLRRELIAHMEAGGKWRHAGGYRMIQSEI